MILKTNLGSDKRNCRASHYSYFLGTRNENANRANVQIVSVIHRADYYQMISFRITMSGLVQLCYHKTNLKCDRSFLF
jgi:hypothetical protein